MHQCRRDVRAHLLLYARPPRTLTHAHTHACAARAPSQDAPKAIEALKALDVPYLCSLPLVFQTTEEWLDSELGVHPVQVALQVRDTWGVRDGGDATQPSHRTIHGTSYTHTNQPNLANAIYSNRTGAQQ